jgi:hypothetical protein
VGGRSKDENAPERSRSPHMSQTVIPGLAGRDVHVESPFPSVSDRAPPATASRSSKRGAEDLPSIATIIHRPGRKRKSSERKQGEAEKQTALSSKREFSPSFFEGRPTLYHLKESPVFLREEWRDDSLDVHALAKAKKQTSKKAAKARTSVAGRGARAPPLWALFVCFAV